MGGNGSEGQAEGGTMVLDSMVDSMEEYEAPEGPMHAPSTPPPLPPKKISKAMWVVGGFVVLGAASAALGVGLYMMSTRGEAPRSVATQEPAPAPVEPGVAAPEEAATETNAAGGASAGESPHVAMDEFVFEHEGEDE